MPSEIERLKEELMSYKKRCRDLEALLWGDPEDIENATKRDLQDDWHGSTTIARSPMSASRVIGRLLRWRGEVGVALGIGSGANGDAILQAIQAKIIK